MTDLTRDTLHTPYDETTFIAQLREAGIPRESIEAMLRDPEPLLKWLYEDIERREVNLLDGERHSTVVGVFITDGSRLLLERQEPEETYAMGGQVAIGEEVRRAVLREIAEETGMEVDSEPLEMLGARRAIESDSRKLPGVPAPRTVHQFVYRVPSLDVFEQRENRRHIDESGEPHDLLVLPITQALEDERVDAQYRTALRRYRAALEG